MLSRRGPWFSKEHPQGCRGLWSGNTIQKSLLMAVYAARHFLEDAELFCRLELDSAFSTENLRAFARGKHASGRRPSLRGGAASGMKLQVGNLSTHTAGGVCMTREALRRLSRHLELLDKTAVTYPFPEKVAFWAQTVLGGGSLARRVNDCGFVAGHWWDIMLGRCFVASNVTAHPAVEDEVGRYYFATQPLPCQEHLAKRQLPALPGPKLAPGSLGERGPGRVRTLRLCPRATSLDDLPALAGDCSGRLLAFALRHSYHGYKNLGYKNLTDLRHAYRILCQSAGCNWALPFRPRCCTRGQPLREKMDRLVLASHMS